ncbi:MAG: UbiA family prenyltransferase, partial [Desulfobacterales bacterium]
IQAMRVHHWLKNLLLGVPLVTSHNLADISLGAKTVVALLAFNLAASGGYLINDFLDLEADRRHPVKRQRPLAAGTLPGSVGIGAIVILLLGALAISFILPRGFTLSVVVYLTTTILYSLWFKRIAIVDVLVLGFLYTLRIIAGCAALSIDLSFWLLGFSMFFFLNLALVKRYAELQGLKERGERSATRRGYRVGDYEVVRTMGIASGYVAVLVLALYMDSEQMLHLYRHAGLLWLLCPLVLFWHNRIWLVAHRGQLNEDPLVYAVSDRASLLSAVLGLIIIWISS